jgi:hypothetical protein
VEIDPGLALGPLGALVLAMGGVYAFTREIVTPGARTRRAEDLAEKAVAALTFQLDVNKSFVDALEERNRLDAAANRAKRRKA